MSNVPFELLKDPEERFTCLKIYLNDNVTSYVGYMDTYKYDDAKEKYIILSGFKKYLFENDIEKIVVDNTAEQYNQKVLIKFSDIKIIEKIAEDIAHCQIHCNDNKTVV